jgi:hypothetical protein
MSCQINWRSLGTAPKGKRGSSGAQLIASAAINRIGVMDLIGHSPWAARDLGREQILG